MTQSPPWPRSMALISAAVLGSVAVGTLAAWWWRPAPQPVQGEVRIAVPRGAAPVPDTAVLRDQLVERVIEDARAGAARPVGLPALGRVLEQEGSEALVERLAASDVPPELRELLAREAPRDGRGERRARVLVDSLLRSPDPAVVRGALDVLRGRGHCAWQRDVSRALSFGACVLEDGALLFAATLDGRGGVEIAPVPVEGGWDLRARRAEGAGGGVASEDPFAGVAALERPGAVVHRLPRPAPGPLRVLLNGGGGPPAVLAVP